ncbi:MAG: YcfL family protein [Phycisphaerae bacterium]|nr:YcfL family protein [Phycisphaerae bacterium]
MTRLVHRLALTFLAGIAAAAGCSSSNTYETKNARPNAIEFDSKISNPFLKGKVDVTSCYVGQADGLLRVQANLVNESAGNALYMYKFTWYDSSGLKIGASTDAWTRRELNGGAQGEITALAPTRATVDWRLEIRPWDR